jgi:hypothetical protein
VGGVWPYLLGIFSVLAIFWRLDAIKRDLVAIKRKLGMEPPEKDDY